MDIDLTLLDGRYNRMDMDIGGANLISKDVAKIS